MEGVGGTICDVIGAESLILTIINQSLTYSKMNN